MTYKILKNFNQHKRLYSTRDLLTFIIVTIRLYTVFISFDETNTIQSIAVFLELFNFFAQIIFEKLYLHNNCTQNTVFSALSLIFNVLKIKHSGKELYITTSDKIKPIVLEK